jgi:hypothetical protein
VGLAFVGIVSIGWFVLSRSDDPLPSCSSVPDLAIDAVGPGFASEEAAVVDAVNSLFDQEVDDIEIARRTDSEFVATSPEMGPDDRVVVTVVPTDGGGFVAEGAYCTSAAGSSS